MNMTCGLATAFIVLAFAPAASADDVLVNGGFELQGLAGPTDSANWIESASGAPGTASRRVIGEAASGLFAHRLTAIGSVPRSTSTITQNGITDGGLQSLEGNTTVNLRFKAKVTLQGGGFVFYQLRILNTAGNLVADSGAMVITSGTNGVYAPFAAGPLAVPAIGNAPNNAYSAVVEITAVGLVLPTSTADALIDDLVVTGTLVSVCNADFNGDGFLDFFDYGDFVTCFETGSCPPGKDADFNDDGFADFFDYDAYVGAFEAGC